MLGNFDDCMGKEWKLFVKLEQPLASGLKKTVWIELPTNFLQLSLTFTAVRRIRILMWESVVEIQPGMVKISVLCLLFDLLKGFLGGPQDPLIVGWFVIGNIEKNHYEGTIRRC